MSHYLATKSTKIIFFLKEKKMSSLNGTIEENFLLIELANRELREDLIIALMLISNEKQKFQ